ncbi:VrrA/YqfQ family protein [Bacillus sp. FSL W7-1360]
MNPFLGPPHSAIPLQHRFPPTGSRLMGMTPTHHFGPLVQPDPTPTKPRPSGRFLPQLFGGGTAAFGEGITLATILVYAQRVIGVTQQVTPMIQQYGPYVKRIPALWRMLRSMQSTQPVSDGNRSEPSMTAHSPISTPHLHAPSNYEQRTTSQPKLYI